MGFKFKGRFTQAKLWGYSVLAFLLLFVTQTGDFKTTAQLETSKRCEILRQSFRTAQALFEEEDLLCESHSSLSRKVLSYRKRVRHLIEGDDDLSPYVTELLYTQDIKSFVQLSYESPHFVSEQQSSLYRLSVF